MTLTVNLVLQPDLVGLLLNIYTAATRIEQKLDALTRAAAANQKENRIAMGGISVRLDKLDAASNGIAAELKKLRDTLASGTAATPEELARFDAQIAALEAMGKDPENPLPEPVVP